ncbi:MAG: glycoside hydrolase family 3 C-terminal domain-containing protein [Clostridiales bacterium]|jgi:beta-glucosidase|nr:glycoside hydrolase family 3 C-terminal domain-containing protein [Clostridiales bacterium]
MNPIKVIFLHTASRVWIIVATAIIALLTAVSILATTTFFDLLNIVMPGGGRRAVYAADTVATYKSDYAGKEQTLAAANDFNIELCREGFVLLKNERGALPLKTPVSDGGVSAKPRISVFGKNSVNLAYGGSGSGGGDSASAKTLYDSLAAAGYECNPTLKNFYENNSASGVARAGNSGDLDSGDTVFVSTAETPQSRYTPDVKASYGDYGQAALVVFTRIGGEGFDLPRQMGTGANKVDGARNADDHYLQLDANETELLKSVCDSGFERVIVLINSGTAMELGFLTHSDYYAYQPKIDAAIWIGFPGNTGIMALGEILNGKVNPSGRLVDTYAKDFKANPVWNNFGDNLVTGDANKGNLGGDQYKLAGGANQLYYFTDYEESVYVGYKYYETRGQTDGQTWYDGNVVYPFGYGLSYSHFTWEVTDASEVENKTVSAAGAYTVKVKVTNDGPAAGKDVVQFYGHAPYVSGKIEKPHVVLLDFAKTELIEPGQSDTVELEFNPYYLASYDYRDANGNGHRGYELDGISGYKLFISRNAHESEAAVPFSVPAGGIKYGLDPVTGNPVVNRYTDCEDVRFDSDTQLSVLLSRSDWDDTWPTSPVNGDERTVSAEFINSLKDTSHNNPNDYGGEEPPYFGESNGLTFRDMLKNASGDSGIFLDEDSYRVVDYDDARWDALLDQAKLADLIKMYDHGAFETHPLENIGKPLTKESDGPSGFTNFMDKTSFYGTCFYCAEIVVASTWNTEISQDFGAMVGNEGIWGNAKGDRMPYSGWYAPGANIHRSPFGGRNFEYFSEDGVLSGKMAAAEIRGAQSKGVYCYIKHFALNEQETHRSVGGNCSWVTEQAMREVFLRPFEIAVKEGKTRAVMSSFNRIGTRWTGGDYRLLTEILRDEWGFRGTVICDFNTVKYMNSKQMAYAGGDLNLATLPESWCDQSDVSDLIVLRKAAKNILYTVINSNAMNGEIIGYALPYWTILLIVFDCVSVVGLAVWGFFAIRRSIKKAKDGGGSSAPPKKTKPANKNA